MNKSTKILSKMFFGLLIVQFFSRISSCLGSAINGIIVGNFLDADSLVALGIVTPVCTIITSLAMFVSGGAQIVCGRLMGRGELKKLNGVFTISIVTLTIIGIILSLVCGIFAESIAVALGATGSIIESTKLYLIAISIGFVPMMVVPTLMVFLQINNDSKFVIISTLLFSAFTLAGSLLNVYYIKKGIFGIGLANTIAQYLVMIIIGFRFAFSKELMKLDFKQLSIKSAGEILFLGLPAAFTNVLYSIRGIFINKFAFGIGGNELVSSLTIFNSVEGIISARNVAVAAVTTMMFSLFVGERDFDTLGEFVKYLSKVFIVIGIIHIGIIILLAKPLASIFGAKGVIYDMTVTLIIIFSFCSLPNLFTIMFSTINQAFGRVWFVNIINIFACLLFPLGWILATKGALGNYSIYTCFVFAEIPTLLIYIITTWIRKKKFTIKLSELINIPKDMIPLEKKTWQIRSIEEVPNVSQELINFCIDNNIDSRHSMYCGLCLEEMAVNIIENSVAKNPSKEVTIDVFAIYEFGKITVRLRDNAPHYDPKTRLTRYDPDNPLKNIGIRIVSELAKEMNYQSTFGTNVFTFVL